MSFLSSQFSSAYITDLILPPPPAGKTAEDVRTTGQALAISMLRDYQLMIHLNPLVKEAKAIPQNHLKAVDIVKTAEMFNVTLGERHLAEWEHREIQDMLPMGLGYTVPMVYHAAMRHTPEGMESLTNAPSGVIINGNWKVLAAKDQPAPEGAGASAGVLNLVETNVTKASVLLSWYIKSTVDDSHRRLHEEFKARWRDGMEKLGYPSSPAHE